MSLRHVWNTDQRRRLLAQLAAKSRSFVAALPDAEAVDGLIINLHLCLTLELTPAEVQEVLGGRALNFLNDMLAAGRSESIKPRFAVDLAPAFSLQPVRTQLGVIDANGDLRPATAPPGFGGGAVRLVFRGPSSGGFASGGQ